jgi:hypothetical protein
MKTDKTDEQPLPCTVKDEQNKQETMGSTSSDEELSRKETREMGVRDGPDHRHFIHVCPATERQKPEVGMVWYSAGKAHKAACENPALACQTLNWRRRWSGHGGWPHSAILVSERLTLPTGLHALMGCCGRCTHPANDELDIRQPRLEENVARFGLCCLSRPHECVCCAAAASYAISCCSLIKMVCVACLARLFFCQGDMFPSRPETAAAGAARA